MNYSEQKKQLKTINRRSFFIIVGKISLFSLVGWKLFDDVFTSTDIQKTSKSPNFIFSNSCGGSSENNGSFRDLVAWRHRQGFTVNTISTSQIGTSTTSIKNYIDDK